MSKLTFYFVLRDTMASTAYFWKHEYVKLCLGGKRDSLETVVEYGNGTIYRSNDPKRTFGLPWGCVRSTKAEYTRALLRFRKDSAERKRKEKEARQMLRGGMQRHEHASREAGATVTSPELVAVVAAPAPALVLPADVLADYTVFDCETTGFSPETDCLLEVAATRFVNGVPVDSMQSLVYYTGFIRPDITNLTGIQASMVAKAPELRDVLVAFKKVAGDSLLVGHNVGFDIRFVNAGRTKLGAKAPLPNNFLCTQVLAKARYPKLPSYKLGKLCERFGISTTGAHRAGKDVLMTAKLLQLLHAQQPIDRALVNATSAPKPTAVAGPDLFALAS